MKKNPAYFSLLFSVMIFGTKVSAQVSQKAIDEFLNDSVISTGHAGISIYDLTAKKYLYNYNAEKNFVPSSNVKLFTLYAGMKYLKDSIPGLYFAGDDSVMIITPAGDPTFLHPDFADQPVFRFLTALQKKLFTYNYDQTVFREYRYGSGWDWDDYQEDFMAERSYFPIYGNVVSFHLKSPLQTIPGIRRVFSMRTPVEKRYHTETSNEFVRDFYANNFDFGDRFPLKKDFDIPFITSEQFSFKLLSDTLRKTIFTDSFPNMHTDSSVFRGGTVYSRPVDSLFRPMMFNSDNFFAEQTLLMVSNKKLGYMSDEKIIDSLLKNDFKDIPTKPRWVDGSGLSRYNLFSPKDFIYILVKLQAEFGVDRVKRILPAGGEGTLTNYYADDANAIHAKTGSMSNNVSLSGFITGKRGRSLLFSVMINNFSGTGRSGRKAIERLIRSIIETN